MMCECMENNTGLKGIQTLDYKSSLWEGENLVLIVIKLEK